MLQHLNTIWYNWSELTEYVRSGVNSRLRPVVGS